VKIAMGHLPNTFEQIERLLLHDLQKPYGSSSASSSHLRQMKAGSWSLWKCYVQAVDTAMSMYVRARVHGCVCMYICMDLQKRSTPLRIFMLSCMVAP